MIQRVELRISLVICMFLECKLETRKFNEFNTRTRTRFRFIASFQTRPCCNVREVFESRQYLCDFVSVVCVFVLFECVFVLFESVVSE